MVDADKPDIPPHNRTPDRTLQKLLHAKTFRLLAAAVFMSLTISGCRADEVTQLNQRPAIVEPAQQDNLTLQVIENGRAMATEQDRNMLNTTIPGIDLTYFNNETVAKIRSIEDPTKRVLTAIGFLNVESSGRYNTGVYACNTYALDLLRLVLGNDVIGSRYNAVTGAPTVAGIGDIDWTSQSAVNRLNESSPFLHSNNLDWWMQNYGTKQYGWEQVSPQQLEQIISQGGYIGLAVHSQNFIRTQPPDFLGHSAVVVRSKTGQLGESQATNNHAFRPSKRNNPIVGNPAFHLFVHPLPPPYRH